MNSENKVNVFISYSWDSPEHQQWVLSVADQINETGGNAIVDRTHLKFGGHIKSFMTKSILQADVVLMVLTPKYKSKADSLSGGAGYEYNIINDELFKVIKENEKYIPIIRTGDLESSVTSFLQGFNCVDLRDGIDYEKNLKELLSQILKTPLKQPIENKVNKPVMETEYKELSELTSEMNRQAFVYFKQIFIPDNNSFIELKLKSTLSSWEKEIDDYHKSIEIKFAPPKMALYENHLEDFKNNIFKNELWTVKSALNTSNPDLSRYKKDYREAGADEIYDTVNGILNSTHSYVKSKVPSINYEGLKEVGELGVGYLDSEEMFMNRIIGYGIRSEILHRYYPAYFPIMTQKNLWAMYFLCDSAKEFITVELKNRKGIMRVSHNWQYPYDRFTFLMNVLANELGKWFKEYGIKTKPEYRFGYVNLFLYEIHDLRKSDIKILHEWVDSE